LWVIWDIGSLPGAVNTIGVGDGSAAVDGDTSPSSAYAQAPAGMRALTVDLGKVYEVDAVKVWHYYNDGRTYNGTRVEVGLSTTSMTTVFDSAISGLYPESAAGKTHAFAKQKARFVRDWVNGSSVNPYNHWMEVEVYGDTERVSFDGQTEGGVYTNLVRSNGPAEIIDRWNRMAVAAGFPGLSFVSMYRDGRGLGIPALMAYNHVDQTVFNVRSDGLKYADYDAFTTGFEKGWADFFALNQNCIVNVSPGWDDSPLYPSSQTKSITHNTPDKFRTLLNKAKSFVNGNNIPPKLIMNEAWDEWGEGAVLAPTDRWGFGHLDALRREFTDGKPPAPSHLRAKGIGGKRINLIWTPAIESAGFDGYIVYRNGVEIGRTSWPHFSDESPISPGVLAQYHVVAVDAQSAVSLESNTVDITLNSPPPLSPTLYVSGKDHSLEITWSAVEDDKGSLTAGYSVDVSLNPSFSEFMPGWQDRNVGNALSATVTGLASGTSYYVRARAFDRWGNPSNPSPTIIGRTLASDDLTVNGARCYPNPFRRGGSAQTIVFDHMPPETSLRILTMEGKFVTTLTVDKFGRAEWDLRNRDGSAVANGVYVAILSMDGHRKTIKFIVEK
jgi:hypothetical protein